MNLLGLNHLWQVDGSALKLNEAGLGDKLLIDAGVTQQLIGMRNAIEAIADPSKAINKVSAELIDDAALIVPIIKSNYDELIKLGTPSQVAEEYALEKGNEMLAASVKFRARANPLVLNNPEVLLSKTAGVDLRTKTKAKAAKAAAITSK
eukprot:TRINITY_DN15064_c0_g1_i1.p1 TRINITY_DN15064_c0_g1~~TRINITY_DN15064_c0_g1_i1.p1  ORF type:complete len:150 (+),score=10.87 TRINITY_DN15064_c0_g1_i1:37-486(+)